MTSPVEDRRIGTEVQQSHTLLRWVAAAAAANLGFMLLGGITIWVNDKKQDDAIARHGTEIAEKQTKREADLMRELLEAKIGGNTQGQLEIKQILVRMETAINDIRKEGQ